MLMPMPRFNDQAPLSRGTVASDPPTSIVRHDNFRDLPPGSMVGDTYEIDARLGAGSMGEVYAAHHVKLGKRVAIKVIRKRLSEDTDAIERFAMEARTLAQVQHPAIVAVDHIGELSDGRAFFVMEYLKGESLFERMTRGRLPLLEALRVIDQMARGLEAAHGQGVIHRDLKPENTFLVHLPDEPPIVKLVDFGLAKLAADRVNDDYRAQRTQSGVALGTPMYMSPEQARGVGVDHRTDIYALGCIAYELLLGVGPFTHARTAPELYAAHLHADPPLPRSIWPEIHPQLDLVLFAMLAKDPDHRPTLAQIRSVLTNLRVSTPSQRAITELIGPRAMRRRQRVPWGKLGIVAIGASLGFLAGTRLSTRSEKSAPTVPLVVPTVSTVPVAASVQVDAMPPLPPHKSVPAPNAKPTPKPSVPSVPSVPRVKVRQGRDQIVNPFSHKTP